MSRMQDIQAKPTRAPVRCAIYTRKSTEDGLDQDFNSLDAQRAAAVAYIQSQAHDGWHCLPTRYDDGGFSGRNLDRPALARLLTDIAQGHIDCVLVYKVDRLSRSLLDFARLMATFEEHHVAFVSVTQQFNTATSMGRLVLNVLLSFAQFERELIAERTRDKIAAARRKGKWAGGHPVLGYDIDARTSKLVVNDTEAARVRAIFELYLEHQGLRAVVEELERRGWRTKRWTTRHGRKRGGRRFTKASLYRLLTNVTYIGQAKYKEEIHAGEHAALVEAGIWQRVHEVLKANSRAARERSPGIALLKGLLRCVPCGCAMTPAYTARHGKARYRYYVCSHAQKRGWHTCPSKALPAGAIESFVIEQIQALATDSTRSANTAEESRMPPDALTPPEQARLVRRLVERVDYDGASGTVTIRLPPPGHQAVASAPLTPPSESNDELILKCTIRLHRRGRGGSRAIAKGREHVPPVRSRGRVPRVSRFMALALRFAKYLRTGHVRSYGELARLGQVSRPRISQILNLLNLAPDLQEALLMLPRIEHGRDALILGTLQPIASTPDWEKQRRLWAALGADLRARGSESSPRHLSEQNDGPRARKRGDLA